jgi:hypothetical protein
MSARVTVSFSCGSAESGGPWNPHSECGYQKSFPESTRESIFIFPFLWEVGKTRTHGQSTV